MQSVRATVNDAEETRTLVSSEEMLARLADMVINLFLLLLPRRLAGSRQWCSSFAYIVAHEHHKVKAIWSHNH